MNSANTSNLSNIVWRLSRLIIKIIALLLLFLALLIAGYVVYHQSDAWLLRYALWREQSPMIDNGDGSYTGVIPSLYAGGNAYNCWLAPYQDVTFHDGIPEEDRAFILDTLKWRHLEDGYLLSTISKDHYREIALLRVVELYFSRDRTILNEAIKTYGIENTYKVETQSRCFPAGHARFTIRIDHAKRVISTEGFTINER
jgi:hypothetical protein